MNDKHINTDHLTDEEVFLVANELDHSNNIVEHLNSCADCQVRVQDEKSFAATFQESLKSTKKISVNEQVMAKLMPKAEPKLVFSRISYFIYGLVAIIVYWGISGLKNLNFYEDIKISIPSIPYLSSVLLAMILLVTFYVFLINRSKVESPNKSG